MDKPLEFGSLSGSVLLQCFIDRNVLMLQIGGSVKPNLMNRNLCLLIVIALRKPICNKATKSKKKKP